MKSSQRAQNMPFSPIRKLAPLAEQAKRRGTHVFHLNIGQPDIKTPQCALDALKSYDESILAYGPSEGRLEMREAMSRYYASCGISLSASEIIITTGGSEAVLFAFLACLDPGDEVIITEPFYANYIAFASSAGAVIKSVKTSIQDGFRLPPMEAFEEQISPKTKAILICNPNNPTGYLYTPGEMQQLRELVLKYDLYLFSDEVYREFVYTGKPYISAFQLEGLEQHVVLIDSVSKRYSECGVRIGCLCTKNPAVREAVLKFCQARLCPPLLGQIVAEASIGVSKDYLSAVYEEYLGRRDFLLSGLNEIPGVYSPVPMGAFYTVAKLPVDDAERFCAWCLSEFSHEGCTVMLAPAAGFYTEPEEGRQEVRIAYVLCKEDLARALVVLRKALEAYPGRVID